MIRDVRCDVLSGTGDMMKDRFLLLCHPACVSVLEFQTALAMFCRRSMANACLARSSSREVRLWTSRPEQYIYLADKRKIPDLAVVHSLILLIEPSPTLRPLLQLSSSSSLSHPTNRKFLAQAPLSRSFRS